MLRIKPESLSHLAIHYVGNKLKEEGVKISDNLIDISDPVILDLLNTFFIGPFKKDFILSNFTDATNDLNFNNIYVLAATIFEEKRYFKKSAENIAKYLYECSLHPKIQGGELYIAYFKGCEIEKETVDALGIFKSELREKFLKVNSKNGRYQIRSEEGININKLDKGCLIFDTEKKNGFKICVLDNLNKSSEAQYWRDTFLRVKSRTDSYHYTKNLLDLTKLYVTEQLTEDFEVTKADQIDYLNRSMNYLRKNENFNEQDFTREIFQDEQVAKSFNKFKREFEEENDFKIKNSFLISSPAVRKQTRTFKSVIKLDQNFHIYIHGNKNLIEQGYDSKTGKKFYKIYFDEES